MTVFLKKPFKKKIFGNIIIPRAYAPCTSLKIFLIPDWFQRKGTLFRKMFKNTGVVDMINLPANSF